MAGAVGRFSLKIQIKLNPFIFIIFNGAPAVQQKDYSYLCISFVFCFHPLFHCNMLIIFLFLFVNEILMVLCFYISFCSFSFLPGISFGSFSFEKPMKDMGIKEKIKEIKRKTQAARNSGLTMKNTIFNLDFSWVISFWILLSYFPSQLIKFIPLAYSSCILDSYFIGIYFIGIYFAFHFSLPFLGFCVPLRFAWQKPIKGQGKAMEE